MIQTKIRKLKPSDHKYTAKDRINHNELTEKYSDIKNIEELHKQRAKLVSVINKSRIKSVENCIRQRVK